MSDPYNLYVAADQHLTSMLLPKSTNITFSFNFWKQWKWKNVIVDACSPTKPIDSQPVFRPMISRTSSNSRILFQESRLVTWIDQFRFVSCHKEQLPWTNQLTELVTPFSILTWLLILAICLIVSRIAKLSKNLQSHAQNQSIFDLSFSLFWSILDQSCSLFDSYGKTAKCSFYWCVYCIPLSWLYLSTLYKGDNVTRLTAEPPLVEFDTFEMLEEYQFNTYSRRINLNTDINAKLFNVRELVNLHKEYGSVITHEAIPVVSELWYELMYWLHPYTTHNSSLIFLKDQIPQQMWKYINNSAMLPKYGQGFSQSISTILNFHMKWCNKSAIILRRPKAMILHTVLKQMGKPSYFGKDKIVEKFWGYKFMGYFPPSIIFRARYLYEAGVFEWWQKHAEYSLVQKTNVHADELIPNRDNKNGTKDDSKTAVIILCLIPGVGLLTSIFVFIYAEIPIRKALQKHFMAVLTNCSRTVIKLFHDIRRFGFRSHAQVNNTISIDEQPNNV